MFVFYHQALNRGHPPGVWWISPRIMDSEQVASLIPAQPGVAVCLASASTPQRSNIRPPLHFAFQHHQRPLCAEVKKEEATQRWRWQKRAPCVVLSYITPRARRSRIRQLRLHDTASLSESQLVTDDPGRRLGPRSSPRSHSIPSVKARCPPTPCIYQSQRVDLHSRGQTLAFWFSALTWRRLNTNQRSDLLWSFIKRRPLSGSRVVCARSLPSGIRRELRVKG